MTHTELEAALRELSWQPKDIHRLTGKTTAVIRHWRTGVLPVPQYMATIVELGLAVKRSYQGCSGLLQPSRHYHPLSPRTVAGQRRRAAADAWPTPDDWTQG